MVKHSSSILKFHSQIESQVQDYSYHSCLVLYSCYYPMQLCGVLITDAVLLAHPKYSLSHGKYFCNLYFVGNEASSSLVLHPVMFTILFQTQFLSIFILFIMLLYSKFLASLLCS